MQDTTLKTRLERYIYWCNVNRFCYQLFCTGPYCYVKLWTVSRITLVKIVHIKQWNIKLQFSKHKFFISYLYNKVRSKGNQPTEFCINIVGYNNIITKSSSLADYRWWWALRDYLLVSSVLLFHSRKNSASESWMNSVKLFIHNIV